MGWAWSVFALMGFVGAVFSQPARLVGQAQALRRQIGALPRPQILQILQIPHLPQGLQDPPASAQPPPPTPGELSVGVGGPERLGPFERLDRGRTLDTVQALVLSLLLTGMLAAGLIGALLLVQPSTSTEVGIIVLLLGLPAAGCLWLTVLVIRRLRRIR